MTRAEHALMMAIADAVARHLSCTGQYNEHNAMRHLMDQARADAAPLDCPSCAVHDALEPGERCPEHTSGSEVPNETE